MANCTNCGTPLDAAATKCPHCGTSVNQSQSPRRSGYATQQVLYPKTASTPSRSYQIPVLAVLSLVAGIESFLYVGKYNFNPSISALNNLPAMIGGFSSYMPYILEVAGVLALVSTFGYVRKASWAWKLGLVSGVLSAITILAPNLIAFVLGIACLGMLMLPSVKSALKGF